MRELQEAGEILGELLQIEWPGKALLRRRCVNRHLMDDKEAESCTELGKEHFSKWKRKHRALYFFCSMCLQHSDLAVEGWGNDVR